jgi:hypothetical protein
VEGRVLADKPSEPVFRKAKIHVVGELIQCCARYELSENLVLHPEGTGLLPGERHSELPREQAHLALVGQAEIARRHLDVADSHHGIGRIRHHQCLTAPHHE